MLGWDNTSAGGYLYTCVCVVAVHIDVRSLPPWPLAWRPCDRTPYKGDRKISFVSYHTRAISMNIVRATAWTLHDAAQKAKGRLCGKRAGSPAALG